MAQAYTPGLEVSAHTKVIKRRELPLAGRALVKVGDEVDANTPVLAADLPGELDIVRIADRLGLDPEQVVGGMMVKPGDLVKRGQPVCEVKSFFGFFTSQVHATCEGTVEFFTEANAHLAIRRPPIPLTVEAYVKGRVIEVEETKSVTIEAEGAFLQGIFGVGGETQGRILVLDVPTDTEVTPKLLEAVAVAKLSGAIVVGGRNFNADALKLAGTRGVRGVVTGSIDAETLRDFVGHEIGVSVTGDENVPCTLIITEGFGALPISARVVELARTVEGKEASASGATQVRAGAMRPEVIIPGSAGPLAGVAEMKTLEIGSRVRLIRVPYFGKFGVVSKLPHDPAVVASGATVRIANVKLESGEEVMVPRANLELA
ncbi:MAG: hypothetical protein U0136_06930 [Bdellovibrionota bacterium]